MPQFLKQLFDLARFKGHPQHIPGTPGWLLLTAAMALVTETLVKTTLLNGASTLLPNFLNMAVFAGLVWLLLRTMSRSARWLQTMTAILGIQALLNILSFPFASAAGLQFIGPAQITAASPQAALVVTLVVFWSWLLTAHIFRLASESSFLQSLISITIVMIVSSFIALLILQGMAPTPIPTE